MRAPAVDPISGPAETLARLHRGTRPFLLDGAADADGLGRYSFAGCDPDDGLIWRSGDAGDPFALLEAAQTRWQMGPIDSLPWPFAVGYLAYDLLPSDARVRGLEDDLGLPAVDFARYPAIWRFDQATGQADVLARDGASAQHLLDRLSRTAPPFAPPVVSNVRWETSDEIYFRRVERVLEYLRSGDVYQINLSHRLRADISGESTLPLYVRLRSLFPAPLGAYLHTDAGDLLSNSPELFLSVSGRTIETRPIKGTRPRGADAETDERRRAELEASEKDRAEHLMIVDLERNDLGRLSEIGSVIVEGFARSVRLPTVHHLVSTVKSTLRPGVRLAEILRATFPGGSITGAPKIRAIEIIAELEGRERGPYCGAIGWFGGGGQLELSLAIRTAVVRGGEFFLSVGGGIVVDSTPQEELAESHAKAAAFVRALEDLGG